MVLFWKKRNEEDKKQNKAYQRVEMVLNTWEQIEHSMNMTGIPFFFYGSWELIKFWKWENREILIVF